MPLIGGFTIAASQVTGSEPELLISYPAAENNDESYFYNYPHLKDKYFLLDEENNFIDSSLKKKFDKLNKNIDIVTGVPFCGGLSQLNVGNKNSEMSRGPDAIQNRFMYLTSEFVLSRIQPKVYIFENAPNLFTKIGEPVFNRLIEIATKNNYSISAVKTTTLNHGIPQNRTRTFIYFWKSEKAPILEWIEKPYPKMIDFFNNITDTSEYHNIEECFKRFNEDPLVQFIINKEGKNYRNANNGRSFSMMGHICSNNYFEEAIKFCNDLGEERVSKNILRIKKKIDSGKGFWDASALFLVNYTGAVISRNCFRYVHPKEDRFLSTRELMHLMGLPLEFKLRDKFFNHITQNVPVNTAADQVEQAIKFIEGSLKISNKKVIKQNNISKTIQFINVESENKLSFMDLLEKP